MRRPRARLERNGELTEHVGARVVFVTGARAVGHAHVRMVDHEARDHRLAAELDRRGPRRHGHAGGGAGGADVVCLDHDHSVLDRRPAASRAFRPSRPASPSTGRRATGGSVVGARGLTASKPRDGA